MSEDKGWLTHPGAWFSAMGGDGPPPPPAVSKPPPPNYPGTAKSSTVPMYRMPDNSWTTNEKLARQTWVEFLERERAKSG